MIQYLSYLQDGLLYGILALGVLISFRILDIPDLTTEGSFGFGSSVAAVITAAGYPILSLPISFIAGMAAGAVTGLLQTKLKVHPVIAGIITMSGLYSINLMILGGPNLPMEKTLFKMIRDALNLNSTDRRIAWVLFCLFLAAILVAVLIWFFRTHIGMCIRATGDNPDMVRASSINVDRTKILGLCIANGLIALSGGLIAHSSGYSDIHSNVGTLVYGLAAVIIGEAIFGRRNVWLGLISAVSGSIIYNLIVAFVVNMSLFGDNSANLMKLMSALIIAVVLSLPAAKSAVRVAQIKKEAKHNAGNQ